MSGQYNVKRPGRFCLSCGERVSENNKFCAKCGARINRQPIELQPVSGQQPAQAQMSRLGQERSVQPSRQAPQPRSGQPMQQAPQPRPGQPMQQAQQPRPGQTMQQAPQPRYAQAEQPPYSPQEPSEEPPQRKSGKKKAIIVFTVILAVLIGTAAYAYYYLRSALDSPPDVRANPRGHDRIQASGINNPIKPDQGVGSSGIARNTGKYTFLVLGCDAGEYNTDVIMAVTFDTVSHSLDVVNIPRDTLVNVSWNLKKANSILATMRAEYGGKDDAEKKTMDATIGAFADVLGYEVDYSVQVNMRAVVTLIDAVDGVDFYVPVDMHYDDHAAGLSIHYSKGMQHLTGQQALEVMRFRSGYSNADIGRISTQQELLKSAAEQILAKRDSIDIVKLAGIFIKDVKTDIKLDDLIWFGRAFLKLDAENISFHMMPGDAADSVRGQSYVTIYVGEWLELINSKLNPFLNKITESDVSILTRGADRRFYVTDGNRRGDSSWGS